MISSDRISFQKQIYNFLRTVSIKYAPIADYINDTLSKRGYSVNYSNPLTWKYYINLVGDYHPTDSLMYVQSIDTQERILFSKENLVLHPRTKLAYSPGGKYFTRLCEIYPSQTDLIKSILFPVEDITKAIDSEDFTILKYGEGYLDDYEEGPLVEGLKSFLEIIHERWYFEFLDDEPYFHITFYSGLWVKMAAFLLTERENFIHTPYVHKWHIWNRLRDAGLDDYSDILNREKSMMLYQNMDYLKANAGKMSNLAILANRLLEDFGIAIYARRVVQESETRASEFQLNPQLQAVRIPTNNKNTVTEVGDETVETIQNRAYSKGFAVDNSSESASAKERKLGDTTLNDFMTKFLEIRPIASNKKFADILNVFLLETLLTSILNNHYTRPLAVDDPITKSMIYLYPKELLALYHYASMKSIGITPVMIPTNFFFNTSFNTEIGSPSKTITIDDEKIYLSMYVNSSDFLSELNYDENLENPSQFSDMASRLWLRYLEHLIEDISTSIETKRHILSYLSSLCHTRRIETHTLVANQDNYENWLGLDGIDIQSSILDQYDTQLDKRLAWGNLADTIMSALIPMTDTLVKYGNYTLNDFGYERLRQILIQMCSYKVVFLDSNRDIPNYSNGAKWSNRYGPDEFSGFSDYIVTKIMSVEDGVTLTDIITIHPGYIENIKNSSVDECDHVTNMESLVISNELLSSDDLALNKHYTSSIDSNDGVLEMSFSNVVAVDLIINDGFSKIIDIDSIPITDIDGSFIVDPNS